MYIARQAPCAVGRCCRSGYITSAALLLFRHAASSRAYSNGASVWHLKEIPSRSTGTFGRQNMYSRARRRFSVSSKAMHGHLTPPKPGEEWVFPATERGVQRSSTNAEAPVDSMSHSSIRKERSISFKWLKVTIYWISRNQRSWRWKVNYFCAMSAVSAR